ncbi:MAG: transposase [Betaproteobacteria bacterium]|nr:transposase [Betaproteobacteria bacterium]
MARKPRLHVPGGLYHVILRGNAGQDVFFSAGDRRFFYELLAEGVVRFGYRVHAFCLMSNHLHLALQVGDLALSAGMQNLSFRYTRYLNTRLKRSGHVFQGRFKAFLVDQDRYGLALVRYLHLNAVRARMVRQPRAYAWSSHRAYLGEEDLPWLTTDWVLGQFGERVEPARQRFAAFVDAGARDGHSEVFYGGQADGRVVGEEAFLKKVLKVLPKREAKRKAPSLRQIVAYVCDGYGLTEGALKAPGKGRQTAQARALIGWLAVRFRSCTLAEVAEHFSRSPSTLSHLVANLEKLSHSSGQPADALRKHLFTLQV